MKTSSSLSVISVFAICFASPSTALSQTMIQDESNTNIYYDNFEYSDPLQEMALGELERDVGIIVGDPERGSGTAAEQIMPPEGGWPICDDNQVDPFPEITHYCRWSDNPDTPGETEDPFGLPGLPPKGEPRNYTPEEQEELPFAEPLEPPLGDRLGCVDTDGFPAPIHQTCRIPRYRCVTKSDLVFYDQDCSFNNDLSCRSSTPRSITRRIPAGTPCSGGVFGECSTYTKTSCTQLECRTCKMFRWKFNRDKNCVYQDDWEKRCELIGECEKVSVDCELDRSQIEDDMEGRHGGYFMPDRSCYQSLSGMGEPPNPPALVRCGMGTCNLWITNDKDNDCDPPQDYDLIDAQGRKVKIQNFSDYTCGPITDNNIQGIPTYECSE